MRESHRERTLLRLIEQQQRIIADLNDRLMHLAERPWNLPPSIVQEMPMPDEGEPMYSALHGLPPGYDEEE